MMNERKPIFNVIPAAGNLTALQMNVFFYYWNTLNTLRIDLPPTKNESLGIPGADECVSLRFSL